MLDDKCVAGSRVIGDDFIAPICEGEIDLIHEDDVILVINKPSGLLSLSGKHPLNYDSVHYRLRQDYPDCKMIHRLDFGTSGLMVIAKDLTVSPYLNRQFQARQVIKHYTAILFGQLEHSSGVIDYPLAKAEFPRHKVCLASGKAAMSHYRVLERLDHGTRVHFSPQTGRTHQLRLHSQAIGHPILGCDLYGHSQSLAASQRLMLHASYLEFTHPLEQKRMSFECPSPF